MNSARLKIYRLFFRLLQPWLPRLIFSRDRLRKSGSEWPNECGDGGSGKTIWFHAASAGELEGLWPIIHKWLDEPRQAIVTVFSESGRLALDRLVEGAKGKAGQIIYSGYPPWEGSWEYALRKSKPQALITTKYEAWPDLWATLAGLDIPLVIVGAMERSSLRFAKKICALLGSRLPRMMLLVSTSDDVDPLKELFPDSKVIVTGDPRWDRVEGRIRSGHKRAEELISAFSKFPRPWGVLAQVWLTDLEICAPLLKQMKGTVLVVPHKIDELNVSRIHHKLIKSGLNPMKTSLPSTLHHHHHHRLQIESNGPVSYDCVFVDELGVLAELYKAADWAFIGGGFGNGTHSTIEPAIHAIPIACGPKGREKFPEINAMEQTGQLTIIRNQEEWRRWIIEVNQVQSEASKEVSKITKEKWREFAASQYGATERILSNLSLLGLEL